MESQWLEKVAAGFTAIGAQLQPGLAEADVERIETSSHTALPEDLRALLLDFTPTGPKFPNWRNPECINEFMKWVADGIWFDVERNGLWFPEWGPRPDELSGDERHLLDETLAAAPKLAPLYGHRCLPCSPTNAGNPVLSVMQTDIIYYGRDLLHYLSNEAVGRTWTDEDHHSVRDIPFWTALVG